MAAMWHYGSIDESRSLPDSPLSIGQTASQPPQQHIQPMELPPLTEERFMDLFMMFSCATGVRLKEQDFTIEGRQVNPWALHRAVFARNGFDSVTASGKWPVIGAILGFPTFSGHGHVPGQLTDRGPVIAHRLQQIYQDSLRHFDQAYINSVSARLGSVEMSSETQVASQLHSQWRISATVESGSSTLTSEATSILPSFPHASCADLGTYCVPQDLESVQPNGDHFQRATQGLYLSPTPADHAQRVYPVQINQTPGFQEIDYPSTHTLKFHQHQRSGREPIHGGVTHLSRTLQQQQQFLRLNVARGVLTQQQAREQFARFQPTFQGYGQSYPQQLPLGLPVGGMPGGTTLQQISTIPQHPSVLNNDQMNPFQRVIQGHDPPHARQVGTLLTQQQHGSGFAGQTFNPPGMVFPQGQGSPQQSFVQPSPPVLPARVQSSSSPSMPQATSPGAQQTPWPSYSFPRTSLLQLQGYHSSLKCDVEEGENKLQSGSATDSGDDDNIVRQLRAKIDVHKQRVLVLQEYIDAKSGASGDPAQQSVIVSELARRLAALFPKPTQISPHVSIDIDLLRNGTLAHMAGALPQVVHHDISTLLEERFKSVVMHFTAYTGMPLGESDLIIKDRQIIPLALHKAVFLRNGFDAVCTNDEWPALGVILGFPSVTDGDIGQPVGCEPAIARQLQQLYDDILRHFDQAYVTNLIPRLESLQTADQVLIQPLQSQAHQPTESDYQAILTSITSDLSLLTSEVMSILPQFASTSCVEIEAHRVLSHVLSHVLRLRRELHLYPQMIAIPSLEHIQNPQQRQRLQQSAIARSIAHGMAQIFRKSEDGESSMTFGSVFTASAGAAQIRRPSVDEVAVAKVWVDEQKRTVFRSALDANANHRAVPDSDVQEYHRNLERLDQVLANVEKYIHIAFAALGKGDVVRRMFEMMASVKVQLESLKKPNPRYVLELHKIRGMIQEAENMDKGLRTLLGARTYHRPTIPARGGPWPPPPILPPPPSMGIPPPPPPPPFTRPGAITTTQEVASAPALDEEMSLWEGSFQEEVRIAMNKLRI